MSKASDHAEKVEFAREKLAQLFRNKGRTSEAVILAETGRMLTLPQLLDAGLVSPREGAGSGSVTYYGAGPSL